jgi:peptidoglycan-N-acetylglucosamine deacetylase
MKSLRLLLLAIPASTLAFLTGCPDDEAKNTCVGSTAAALSETTFDGQSLPDKTLALTFDDGPGARTAELSAYLKQQGIQAGFFINGQNIVGNDTTVLQTLVADGHIVANHTQTHADLTALAGQAIVDELTQTDVFVAPLAIAGRLLFRPPYGAFDANTYAALQASAMSKYVGPIGWDVGEAWNPPNGAADWDCFQDTGDSVPPVVTIQTCGDLYLTEIRTKKKGIVLLHDPYGDATHNTVDMIKYVVPTLKAEGYTFVRVDHVPAIEALLPPLPQDAGSDADIVDATPPIDAAPQDAGGKPDPCPASPQATTSSKTGESGHFRGR